MAYKKAAIQRDTDGRLQLIERFSDNTQIGQSNYGYNSRGLLESIVHSSSTGGSLSPLTHYGLNYDNAQRLHDLPISENPGLS